MNKLYRYMEYFWLLVAIVSSLYTLYFQIINATLSWFYISISLSIWIWYFIRRGVRIRLESKQK